MPFNYERPDNYVGTIADLMRQVSAPQAAAAQQIGQAQADAARAKGQLWMQALGNIGQSLSSIPNELRANQLYQSQMAQRDLQMQGEKLDLAAKQRQAGDLAALDQAFQQQGRDAILNALPGHLRPQVMKQFQEADESAAKVQKSQADASSATNDYLGSLAAAVKANGYAPEAAQLALSHAKQAFQGNPGMLGQLQQYEKAIQASPDAIRQIVDGLLAQSPKQQELDTQRRTAAAREKTAQTGADRLIAEMPKIGLETTRLQQETTGTTPVTPYQQMQNKLAQGTLDVARGRLSLEQQKAAQAQADKTELTPQGLDAAALMFAKTGQLPALGMGDKTTRKSIINRAAVLVPDIDIASAKADYEANKKSLDNITGTLDSVESFSSAAKKNYDQFMELAKQMPDTGVPWLNTPIRLLTDKMVGADYMPALNMARSVANREFARISGDPKLKGVLSDSARNEVNELVPGDITFAQLKRIMPVVMQDMENVHTGLRDQKSAIQERLKKATDATKTPAGDPLGLFGGKK